MAVLKRSYTIGDYNRCADNVGTNISSVMTYTLHI